MTILEFSEVLANLAGIGAGEFRKKITKEGSDNELLSKEEVTKALDEIFGQKFRSLADSQLGRGKRESLTAFEKELKHEFGYDSAAKGVELVKEIMQQQSERAVEEAKANGVKVAGKKPEELTFDDVKTLQVVRDAIDREKKKLADQLTNVEKEFAEFKSKSERERLFNAVKSRTMDVFEKNRVALAQDAELKQKQINTFLKVLDLKDFRILEDGQVEVVDEKGDLRRDDRHNIVSLENYILSLNPYGVHQFDPNKSGSGENHQPGKNGQSGSTFNGKALPRFKTDEEFMQWMNRNRQEPREFIEAVAAQHESGSKGN